MPKAPARKPPKRTRAATIDSAAAQAAVKYTDGLTMDALIQDVGKLQGTVQLSLASLSAELTSKLEQAKQLDLAIAEKNQRITELTEKEASAVILDELNILIDQTREEWEREKAQHEVEVADAKSRAEIEAKRQEELDKYEHATRIAHHNDEFNALVAGHQRTEQIRQDDFERAIKVREDAMKAQEDEVAALRKDASEFQTRLDEAVKKAVAEAEARLKNNYEHQLDIVKRESAAAVALANEQIKNAQTALSQEQQRSTELASRATAAEERTLLVMNNALNVDAERRRADTAVGVASSKSDTKGK